MNDCCICRALLEPWQPLAIFIRRGEKAHGATLTLRLTFPSIILGSSRDQKDPKVSRTSWLLKLSACSRTTGLAACLQPGDCEATPPVLRRWH